MKTLVQATETNRRVFMMSAVVGCAAAATAMQAKAQAMLAESDPLAVGFGYKADASKVDKAKQPKYVAGQACNNCGLFQGAAGAKAGGCPLFGAKQVAGKGWCNAWVKKA
jgi:hypothetical protein